MTFEVGGGLVYEQHEFSVQKSDELKIFMVHSENPPGWEYAFGRSPKDFEPWKVSIVEVDTKEKLVAWSMIGLIKFFEKVGFGLKFKGGK